MKQLIQKYKNEFMAHNINIMPCKDNKKPIVEGWNALKKYKDDLTEEELKYIKNINEQALSEHNNIYGVILLPDFIVIDIDPFAKGDIFKDEEDFKNAKFKYIEEIKKKTNIDLFEECKFIVLTPGKEITVGGEKILGGGFHFYFKKTENDYRKDCFANLVLNGEKMKKIDIRRHGHYVVGPGSIRGGGCYELYDEDMSLENITFLPEELNPCVYSSSVTTISNVPTIESNENFAFNKDVVNMVIKRICQIKSISGENGNDSAVKVLNIILDYLPIKNTELVHNEEVISILKTWDDNCSFNTDGQHYNWTVPVLQAKMISIITNKNRKKEIGYLYFNRVQEAIDNVNERTRRVSFYDLNFLNDFVSRLGYSFSSQHEMGIYYKKEKGVLGYLQDKNELTNEWVMVTSDVETNIGMEMQEYIRKIGCVPDPIIFEPLRRVISAIAHKNSYDPFKEELLNLPKWDGKKRISNFFQEYCYTSPEISTEALEYLLEECGLEDCANDEEFKNKMQKSYDLYHEQVAKAIFIGMCSLVFDNKRKFEMMPVFLGDQGKGKTTLVEFIALKEEYASKITFTDMQRDDFGTFMARQHLNHKVLELAENAKRDTADEDTLKGQLSTGTINSKLMYKQHSRNIPLWFMLLATTNNTAFLRDNTGNRRYVPVQIGECIPEGQRIKIEDIGRDIKQIYAEALHYYNEENKVNNPNVPFEYFTSCNRYTFAINGIAKYFLKYLNFKHFDYDSLTDRVEDGLQKLFKNRKDAKDSKKDTTSNSAYFLEIEVRNVCGSQLDERNCSKQRLRNILTKLNYVQVTKCVSVGGVKARNRWIHKDLLKLESKKN